MFAGFGYRDFRVLWLATFVRSAALALELVSRAVLIVELTGSAVLLGAVLAAWMAPNLLMIGLIATAGVSLVGISLAPHLAVVAVCVFFATACVYNMVTVANLALLAHAPEEMRAQALTLMNLAQGTILIGAIIAGALVDSFGPQAALLTMAACLLGAALVALSMPRVRWWLWRRRQYTELTAADWMQASDGDR